MKAFYSDQFVLPLPPGHRFPMAKYRLLRDRVAAGLPQVRFAQAPAASDGELALVHAPAYVDGIASGQIDPQIVREIGFPWSEAMAARARRSVGANLAGGTHHASAQRGGGFCVFNDAAVAARLMQAEQGRRQRQPLRVAIIDLDVHQGNGTASIFAGDPSVFTLSLHGEKNFPFRKVAGDLDVALPDGCGDDDYLHALDLALDKLAGAPEVDPGRTGSARPQSVRLGLAAPPAAGADDGRWLRHEHRRHGAGPVQYLAGGSGLLVSLAESAWMSPTKPQAEPRSAYRVFRTITTRWMDNDAYGHVNNVIYYSWFDTAVNAHLIEQGVLDIHQGETIGLVIETQCNYFAPLAFPQTVEAGIRVAKLGTSSVRYEVGLFAQGEPLTAAKGHFVHVYVDSATRRPVPLPAPLKAVLEQLL